MKWQAIDSAPEEGEFLVYLPQERRKMQVMSASRGINVIGGLFAFDLTPPTHWQPLPTPPEASDAP